MSGFPLLPLVAGKFHFECLQDRGAGFPPFFHSCWPFLRQWGRRIPWLSLEVNGIYFLWDRVSHCTVWSCVSQQGLVIMCIHMQWRVILRAFSQASRVACGQELASRGCLLLCLGFPQILNYHTGTYSAFRNLWMLKNILLPDMIVTASSHVPPKMKLYVPSVLWGACHVLGFSLLYCFMTLWQDK